MLAGVCGLAHATSYTTTIASKSGTLSGESAYLYKVAVNKAPTGQDVIAASITIKGLDFTQVGPNDVGGIGTLFVDLLNTHVATTSYGDSDGVGDYFTTSKFTGHAGTVNVATQKFTLNHTQNYTFNLTAAELITLNALIASTGYFDLGLDPDCVYTYTSIAFNYTFGTPTTPKGTAVPDMATTVLLLGSSLLGLEVMRRKFVAAKAKA